MHVTKSRTPLILTALLLLAGCKSAHDFPSVADLQAVTEPKPIPPASILMDTSASDRYNAELEAWGERLQAAGIRLCRYFKVQGMATDCPEASAARP